MKAVLAIALAMHRIHYTTLQSAPSLSVYVFAIVLSVADFIPCECSCFPTSSDLSSTCP